MAGIRGAIDAILSWRGNNTVGPRSGIAWAIADIAALPTCSEAIRRAQYVVEGGAGVADVEYVCLKNAADTYAWVTTPSGTAAGITILTGSATYDPPSINDDSVWATTVTVTGAVVGDPCVASLTTLTTQNLMMTAEVQANDTVRVLAYNWAGLAVDIASGTVKVVCFHGI